MKILGKVLAILNKDLILIGSSETLSINTTLHVFDEIKSDEIKTAASLDKVFIPKGKILISAHQEEGIYLASHVTHKREVTTISRIPPLLSPPGFLTPIEEEKVRYVPLENPGKLDIDKSLGINVSYIITVGDKVGILDK